MVKRGSEHCSRKYGAEKRSQADSTRWATTIPANILSLSPVIVFGSLVFSNHRFHSVSLLRAPPFLSSAVSSVSSFFMALLALAVLILAMSGHSRSDGGNTVASNTWCVCVDSANQKQQQYNIDYACGQFPSPCNNIKETATCFQPNTVKAHCDYAVNMYYQLTNRAPNSCNFSGTATITTQDPTPVGSSCAYPSSASAARAASSNAQTATPSTTPTTSTSSSTTPYGATPTTGVFGLGPSGVNTDISHGGHSLIDACLFSFFTMLLFPALMVMWD